MTEPLRMLGVFAHPDDESFCAGGTFAKYAQQGAEIKVIAATPGDAGQIRDAKVATRRTLGAARREELEHACQQLGVQHVECWNYRDGTLNTINQEDLTGDIVRAIRKFRPHIVITFGPDGGYGHPDHIAISEATTRACTVSGDAEHYCSQFQTGLLPYAPEKLYHAYFPHSRLLFSEKLVRWLVSLEDRFAGTLDFANALLLLSEETSMLHYTSDFVEIKWFPEGFFIIEQDEPSTKLYFILSGKADVVREHMDGSQEVLATIGAGHFFGEDGLASGQPRNAHVIATESVTCIIFSPSQPTNFAGRGQGAQFIIHSETNGEAVPDPELATTCIDVSEFVHQKISAIAQHRTQFPIMPDMFPLAMLQDIFGNEYFVRVLPPRRLENELSSMNG